MDNGTAVQDTNVVQVTHNYEMFHFIESNREQSRGHIETLKAAFQDTGNFTRVQPILVNESYQIIDGQHRFTACRDLGLPIYYTVVPGLGIAEARSMNILHRGWTVDDFARSYALAGDRNYQEYIKIREDYGYVHSITLPYVMDGDIKGIYKQFRVGEFVMPEDGGVAARQRLDMLSSLDELVPFSHKGAFAQALLRVMHVPGYNHEQMVKKIAANPHLLAQYATVGDYARMLEDIYNYKITESHRLRLY